VATAKQTLDRLAGDADAVSPPEDDNSEDMGKLQMEYDHVFKQMELVKNRLAAADEKLVPGTRQLTMAEANMATARQELISLKDTYGDNPQDVVESLTEKIKVQERLQAQHSDLTTLLRVEETRAGELLPQLRSGLRKRRKVTRLIKFVDLGNRFRNMAGRDRLQARAISKTLRKTTHYVNNFLRQFSMPFTVSIDPEEFEFIAHHRDGTKEAAVRLSAGQGLALGISFWLARTTAFHGELPLFVLDEPTANLDAERVVSVASLFRKLGDELQAAGRQGIVITHHMAVAEASTRKVVLQ
jgi:DNA repair exonuclease SbcCD ATPase subunit